MKRFVNWWSYEKNKKGFYELVLQGVATFHQFGMDYEEFEEGPGNYSTAIIELADGTVKNVPVENIEFTF